MTSLFPLHYVLTDNMNDSLDIFIDKANRCLNQGHKLIQLRKKTASPTLYNQYASALIPLAHKHKAKVLLNAKPDLASQLNSDGVHLTSPRLLAINERPLSKNKWVSAACHDLKQLEHAKSIGVDFVTLSPVLHTATHPEKEPIGWKTFRELSSSVNIPMYALGGMKTEHQDRAISNGACGIAAIHSFWS